MADPRTPIDILNQGRAGRPGAAGGGGDSAARSLGVPRDGAGGLPMGPVQIVMQPPDQFPPASSYFFNPTGNATGITNAAVSKPAALAFNLPANNVGVIRGLTLYVNTMLVTTDIRFDLLVDGAPAPGWGDVPILPRAAASVSVSWDSNQIAIRLGPGAKLQLQIRVIDGGTYQAGGAYTGWHYSKTLAEQFGGVVR